MKKHNMNDGFIHNSTINPNLFLKAFDPVLITCGDCGRPIDLKMMTYQEFANRYTKYPAICYNCYNTFFIYLYDGAVNYYDWDSQELFQRDPI